MRLGLTIGPIMGVASLSWLTAVVGAARALSTLGAPRGPVVLLGLSGVFFANRPSGPPGTLAMLCLFVANFLLRRQGMLTIFQRNVLSGVTPLSRGS
jgi:hypothetical protein